MTLPIQGVHHVAILVDDLERAEKFYAGVLGLEVGRRWPDEKGGTRSVWLVMPGDSILMLERSSAGEARRGSMGAGWHLLALKVTRADLPRVERDLVAAGIALESRTDFSLYVRDPEGNRVAFSCWPEK